MIFGVPGSLISLLVLIAFIFICFLLIKRPIYEIMLLGYVLTVVTTGRFDLFLSNIIKPSTSSLFFAIVAFLLLAHILDSTKVLQRITDIIMSAVGRFSGGAGYVALASSTFMSALSGTGPGNVAATGVFTIPAMISTGFPRSLAANIEMTASSLGPMIPPSATIILAYSILSKFMGESVLPMSQFWLLMWSVGLWFVLQRFVMIWFYCWKYKVKPVPKDQIQPLGSTFKLGWSALLLPVIILSPFIIDVMLEGPITEWVTKAGKSTFSGAILIFTPGLAAVYALLLSKNYPWKKESLKATYKVLADSAKKVVPVAATVYFAYAIAYMFADVGLDKALADLVVAMNLGSVVLVFATVVFFAVIAMILPGSGSLALFGGGFLAIFAASGYNPIMVAAVLPALTGALSGMVPPVAVALYAAIGIAQAPVGETIKMSLYWTGAHLLVCLLLIMGLLPVFGL
jgi:TRAP-type C4-dicarboxylate transport system permease large subunit